MADRTAGLTDPDDAPAAPELPVSRTGDLWLLGRHRLLCGDSTVATDVERIGRKSKTVAGRQGRAVGDRSADPIRKKCTDPHRCRGGLDRGAKARLRTGRQSAGDHRSGWDPELLRLELGELKLSGFDLSLTGFGDLELKDLLAERTAGLTDPDDAPAAPEHPVSQTGDLWLLGRHADRLAPIRLTCPPTAKAFSALFRYTTAFSHSLDPKRAIYRW